jgi:hypothetical protein
MSVDYNYVEEEHIKTAINDMMALIMPNAAIYGHEITQGYVTPCVFTDLRLNNEEPINAYHVNKIYTCHITFFPDESNYDETLDMRIIKSIKTYLRTLDPNRRHMMLYVDGRYIKISNVSSDYIGVSNNKLDITLDFSFIDNSAIYEEREPVRNIQVDVKKL